MIMSANPKASYVAHKNEIDQAIQKVMEGGWYILGPRVKSFEEHFAAYLGAQHCVGMASGTDAIHLCLRALGVGPGDAVITVSHTAVATVAAIVWAGAIPVLVDVDPVTYTIDPQKVEDTLTKTSYKVKAIIAVHLYGHPADMESLMVIANRYGVPLIEDCSQAHGASVANQNVGTLGVCGTFSFYPTKNLGAFGDAGAVVTNDSLITERLRLMQQYGWRERYISEGIGYSSRLDELQAAVLDCKLAWLDSWNERRRLIARFYNQGLSGLPLHCPVEREGYHHVYHQYVIQSTERDKLRKHLLAKGIQTAILYPMAVHQQPGFRERVIIGEGGMDITEHLVQNILCLPVFPELEDIAMKKVIDEIQLFFSNK